LGWGKVKHRRPPGHGFRNRCPRAPGPGPTGCPTTFRSRHRSSPPYLLIVFVFLFLIATTLAVIAFTKLGDRDKIVASQKKQVDNLKKSVGDRDNLIGAMAFKMSGTNTPAQAVLADAEDLQANLKLPDSRPLSGGLIPDLKMLLQMVQDAEKRAGDQAVDIKKINAELDAKNAKIAELIVQEETKLKEVQDQKVALTAAMKEQQDAHQKQMDQLNETLEKVRSDLEKQLQEKDAVIEKHLLDLQEKKTTISKLREQVETLLANLRGGEQDIINEPDGQIKKVALDSAVCYVNLGEKDKVRQGMTFAVYAPGATNKDDYKAKIRVAQVSENFCECKIVEQRKDDPVQTDDNVANLAYHVVKTYVFVVKGEFDLHGGVRPSAVGTQEAEDIIRRAGGKIVPEVTVQTDYVVMGDRPSKPVKPADDAPASVWKAYQTRVERYNEFVDTEKAAASIKIPVLNANRFMTFMGYLPEAKPITGE
jgi:hypothetical protein